VNDYAHIDKLKFCGADMEALRDQLVESGFSTSKFICSPTKPPTKS